jgi:hypothetical protein
MVEGVEAKMTFKEEQELQMWVTYLRQYEPVVKDFMHNLELMMNCNLSPEAEMEIIKPLIPAFRRIAQERREMMPR